MSGASRVLALIPAKGCSTRLPRKNVARLGGKTLLEWTVASARNSGVCDMILVSTEDAEIADQARALGAEVPFLRPAELARDPFGIPDVALHALQQLEDAGKEFDVIAVLPPTAPFRTGADVAATVRLVLSGRAPFAATVTDCAENPFVAHALDKDSGELRPLFPEMIGKRGPEMPKAVRPNGAVMACRVDAFRAARNYYGYPMLAQHMPRHRSVDIDHDFDLEYAEYLLRTHPDWFDGADES